MRRRAEDSIAAARDVLASYSPGKAEARTDIVVLVDPEIDDLAGLRIEDRIGWVQIEPESPANAVDLFGKTEEVVTQSQIKRQVRRGLPVVLKVNAPAPLPDLRNRHSLRR